MKTKLAILLVTAFSLLAGIAWNFVPPSQDPAPSVTLTPASLGRADRILEGTSIVFRGGKFELDAPQP
jgi:hypothetical protein